MLYATLVTTQDELLQIHRLSHQNLKQNLSVEDRQNEGFVTWLYNVELLKDMHQVAPSVIVKDGSAVVGYALVTLKEAAEFHPDLQMLFDNLKYLLYNNKPLLSYSFYCMGQICIHKDYRGQGIFDLLYNKHKELYSDKYELLVTEVSTSNSRSQKAHEKVGFKTIYKHTDELDEWNVIVWDWK